MPELTDISVIRALCEKYDFALSKGFGQNFIINPGFAVTLQNECSSFAVGSH